MYLYWSFKISLSANFLPCVRFRTFDRTTATLTFFRNMLTRRKSLRALLPPASSFFNPCPANRSCWARAPAQGDTGPQSATIAAIASAQKIVTPPLPLEELRQTAAVFLSSISAGKEYRHGARTSPRLGRCDFHFDHPSAR